MFFEDEFLNDAVEDHDLAGRHALHAGQNRGEELLRDDPLHVERQRATDRLVHVGGEEVEDTADCRRGRGGVDRSENQVPRFGGVDGRLERFAVTHFPDEHHVGVFPHGMFHADAEVDDVLPDLPLVDQAFVFGKHEFDRVFEG